MMLKNTRAQRISLRPAELVFKECCRRQLSLKFEIGIEVANMQLPNKVTNSLVSNFHQVRSS